MWTIALALPYAGQALVLLNHCSWSGFLLVGSKREDGELDDEALDLTDQLLSANPDFYTLWNFRREVFLELTQSRYEGDAQWTE